MLMTTCLSMFAAVVLQAPVEAPSLSAVALEKTFKTNDAAGLELLLEGWAKESHEILQKRPRSRLEITAVAEEIYTAVVVGHLPATNSQQYFMIPPTMVVTVVKDDFSKYDAKSISYFAIPTKQKEIEHTDRITIADFAPRALAVNKRVLLSDQAHSEELLRFLSVNPEALIEQQWFLDNRSDESRKRSKFLNTRLRITEGSWGLGWGWLSSPVVGPLFVNGRFAEARVCVGSGSRTEVLALRKENGKWIHEGGPIATFIE